MNMISRILSTTLCSIVIFVAVVMLNAQNHNRDNVLVGGQPQLLGSDVDLMIEFYEWAFETPFSRSERERYQFLSIQYFRSNPKKASEETAILTKAFANVKTKSESVQKEFRDGFRDSFVKDMRSSSDDVSKLMLGIYRRGLEKTEPKYAATLTSGVSLSSSKLVGRWVKREGSGSRDYTGKTLYNSGRDSIFEFLADGSMLFGSDKNVLTITQCRVTEMIRSSGRYIVSGDTLTIDLAVGTSVGTSTCDTKGNFKKTLSPSQEKKQFVVKRIENYSRPDNPMILCFDGSSDNDCFEFEKPAK